MNKSLFTKSYRIIFGLYIVGTMLFDIFYGLSNVAGFNIVNYFSYFTTLSTVLATVTLLVVGLYKDIPLLRLGATTFMTITCIVYFLLLRNEPVVLMWVNVSFHYLLPAVMVFDWFYNRSRQYISPRRALVVLAFPLVYVAYSLIRGALTDWYPYFFIDVADLGYPIALRNAVGILVAMSIVAILFSLYTRKKRA